MEKVKLLIKGFITNIIFSAILFLCAGKIDYTQGLIFLSVNILSTIMNFLTIYKNTDLINERANLGEGVKSWDKLLLGLSAVIYLIIIVIAGLDSGRYHWASNFSWPLIITGIIIFIFGQILFFAARSQNNFFSSVVQIQKERGHSVCDKGLYKLVRHPGYLGMALTLAGLPLITTSLWSAIPTVAAVILLLIRTSLEDKTLAAELDGYVSYSQKTRYKLIPFIW
jgi:protein-S-isoprenylcysteine O-methyltransferase Ste14